MHIGLFQGAPTSPALFNIYLEQLIESVKTPFPHIWYRLYADDLVFVVRQEHIADFLTALRTRCTEYNMKINNKKSAIMPLSSLSVLQPSSLQIPFVRQYRYLGVMVQSNLSFAFELQRLRQISDCTLKYVRQAMTTAPLHLRARFWITYVRPYFLQLAAHMNDEHAQIGPQHRREVN